MAAALNSAHEFHARLHRTAPFTLASPLDPSQPTLARALAVVGIATVGAVAHAVGLTLTAARESRGATKYSALSAGA